MKNIFSIVVLISISVLFNSCTKRPCGCPSFPYFIAIQYLSKTDSSDLFFGSKAVYNFKKYEMYKMNGSAKNNINIYADRNTKLNDSVIYFEYDRSYNTPIYVALGNNDVDTIMFKQQIPYDTTYRYFDTLVYNGVAILNDTNYIYNLYK